MGLSSYIFATGHRDEEKKIEPIKDFPIPSGYGDNKIVLMVRDPWTLYAYWEIRKDVEDRVREDMRKKGLAASASILRVYDATEGDPDANPRIVSDFELKDWANNWYVHVGDAGRRWMVDIGILCASGEFFRLARSNIVEAPSCGMSDVIDEEWMCQDDLYYRMFAIAGGYGMGTSSLEMKGILQRHLKSWLSSGGVTSGMFDSASLSQDRK